MPILNPFATDAFNMVALTAAINKIPNTYGRLEQLNLMPATGVRTRTIIIEEMSGVLNLLPTQPVGAPGTVGTQGKRKVRSFVNLDHLEQMLGIEETRAGIARDAQLRALDATNAQTIEQKLAVEQRKAAIEIEYITRVHEVRVRLFDLETSRMVIEEEAQLKRLGYRADEIQARIAELTAQRNEIRRFQQEATDAAMQGARETAAIRQAQLVRDHNQRIFESFKRQAEGVFDALLTKSQSIWSAIGNSLKTALLTTIKDVVTSRVAAMLMQLFTGTRVSLAGGGSSGGTLGRLGGLLGIGAAPVFGQGGGPIPGGAAGGWPTDAATDSPVAVRATYLPANLREALRATASPTPAAPRFEQVPTTNSVNRITTSFSLTLSSPPVHS